MPEPAVTQKIKHAIWKIYYRALTPYLDRRLTSVLNQIAVADTDSLRQKDYVKQLIQKIGLARDKRNIYGEDEKYMNPIKRGLWQIPDQLADFAIFLSEQEIKSFIEIGTWTGHTFVFLMAYLSRFNPTLTGITVDVSDNKPVSYLWNGRFKAKFIIGHSGDFEAQPFDLCLIDGDHSFDAVNTDFRNIGINSKICAFHDINDSIVENYPGNDGGVPRFWKEIKLEHQNKKFYEFLSHTKKSRVMGIGVICMKS